MAITESWVFFKFTHEVIFPLFCGHCALFSQCGVAESMSVHAATRRVCRSQPLLNLTQLWDVLDVFRVTLGVFLSLCSFRGGRCFNCQQFGHKVRDCPAGPRRGT